MLKFNTSQIKYNHFETMAKKVKILMWVFFHLGHVMASKFPTKNYSVYMKVKYFVKERKY